jgi:excisionase family DNA binding protein
MVRSVSSSDEGMKVGNLYTVRGAASRLGVSEETVRRYIRERKLNAKKVRSIGLKTVWGIDAKDLNGFAGNNG